MGRLCGGAHEISGIKAQIFLCGWVGVVGWVVAKGGGGVGRVGDGGVGVVGWVLMVWGGWWWGCRVVEGWWVV